MQISFSKHHGNVLVTVMQLMGEVDTPSGSSSKSHKVN
jgi:hypothetical protein